MNKKGFTLIELLAVIVILAIIALIATPAVLNIIEDSKESAAKDSAMTIAKYAETYYISNVTLQGKEVGTIDLTDETLDYKGEKPEKGYVEFDDKGNSYLKMYMNGYCIVSDYDNTVISTKMDSEECTMSNNTSDATIYHIDGPVKYYDPTGQNPNCTSENSVSNIGTNSGCMRWYAYAEEDDSYLMLLDHSITNWIAWNEDKNGTTPDTAYVQLAIDTAGWEDSNISEIRLFRAAELYEIASRYAETVEDYGDALKNWDINNPQTTFKFTTGTTDYDPIGGPHPLGWIFDNLYGCEQYGCNVEQGYEHGYWLEEKAGDTVRAWYIHFIGHIQPPEAHSAVPGIRPVIKVSKSAFSN